MGAILHPLNLKNFFVMVHFYFKPTERDTQKIYKYWKSLNDFQNETNKIIKDYCLKIGKILDGAEKDSQLLYVLFHVFK